GEVVSLDVANVAYGSKKSLTTMRIYVHSIEAQVAYSSGPNRLLCRRDKRLNRRCGGGKRDELPSPHSITSSARASRDCGTVMPSALAVFRLKANTSAESLGLSAGFTTGRRPVLHSRSFTGCSRPPRGSCGAGRPNQAIKTLIATAIESKMK